MLKLYGFCSDAEHFRRPRPQASSGCIPCPHGANFTATEGNEVMALLTWKASLDNQSPSQLSSWVNGSSPCRGWVGILCDMITSHVISINLTSLGLSVGCGHGNVEGGSIIKVAEIRHCNMLKLYGFCSDAEHFRRPRPQASSGCIPCPHGANFTATEGNEVMAPLTWKASLDNQSPSQLSSWVNGSSPCRGWVGILCDMITSHVISINLTSLGLSVPCPQGANFTATEGNEAMALLTWKASLDNQSQSQLSSWVNGSSPCSGWVGILCDMITSHVISINLTSLGLSDISLQ
ncbi:Leucine-rich repeat-containing N-terminal, plant-type [Dillenia turbinata]|uniref:Leucine-rich repeat-containing N-terminal, plant-type n=1 Tax=Dillenia turbinata TaxID=194707 RepID=A0AAN8YXE1_9MAGN